VQWRSARVARSRAATGAFRLRLEMTARPKGHKRRARVLKVGRSRLTLAYRIKTGEERSAVLHACHMVPA